jgi:oligoribonuclease NrnB/cAMP/cGMP phosphodiesterase (DHH superfamily)
MRFIDTTQCGAALTKKFIEHYFKITLSHLDKFIYHINDYDLWIHQSPFSRQLNMLYDMYRKVNRNMGEYRKRFMGGNINLMQEETDYLAAKEKEYHSVYDALELMEFEHIHGGFVLSATQFINELCTDLMNANGYYIVFMRNGETGHISLRHRIPEFNAGEFLTKNNLGGGHRNAAGMTKIEPENIPKVLRTIEKYLYTHYPIVQKQF